MNDNNEYERLIQAGYIEAGTLVINVDDITKMELTEEQVKQEAAKQNARFDKGVVIIDKQGNMKKVSSLMFGYNKHNVQLSDGSYANADDLLKAMETAINQLDSGTIVVDKKGRVLNPNDLMQVISEAKGKIKIGDKSEKVTNQDARYWSVKGANDDVEHKKGVVFLGNDGTNLKPGDYLSIDELLTALNEYIIMKPKAINIAEESITNTVKVTRKYKNRLTAFLAFIAAIITLFSAFRLKNNMVTVQIPEEYRLEIIHMLESLQLNYNINGLEVEFTKETVEQARQRIISSYKTGDAVPLQKGDMLYENSELTGKKVEIGTGIRQAGDYQISGVSIVYNGNMFKWHVDTSLQNPGFEIGKFINDTCEQNKLDLNLVQIRLHMGNDIDFTRTGWIDISKLIKEDTITQEIIGQTSSIASTYSGTIDNFEESNITIDTVNGPVTLNIKDANGNLIAPGTVVIGNDGKEYQIENLAVTPTNYEQIETRTLEGVATKQIENGKKLTWNIKDCSLAAGLLPLLGAIGAAIATKKKNKELEQQPTFLEFGSEEEYLAFKRKFEESKEKYEKTSGFKNMLKRIFYRKEVDIMQNLTEAQVTELYSTIARLNESSYSSKNGDRYEIRNGRIVIVMKDGKIRDITDAVMPHIWQIGKENEIVAEGRLEMEEKENGVHKK